jgi:hypothetical protein
MSVFGVIIPKPSKQVVDIFIEPIMKRYESDDSCPEASSGPSVGLNEKQGDSADSLKETSD